MELSSPRVFTFAFLFLLTSFLLVSCKKDDIVSPPAGGGTVSDTSGTVTNVTMDSRYGIFAVPQVTGTGGVVGVADLILGSGLTSLDKKFGFGGFFKGGVIDSPSVYAGKMLVDTTEIDTMRISAGLIYLLPSAAHPSASVPTPFDGSTSVTFSIAGNVAEDITGFTASIIPPTRSRLTAPTNNASIPRSSNLVVEWDGTGGNDSIIVIAADQNVHTIAKLGIVNNGTTTFTAARLSTLQPGSGYIMLIKYHYFLQEAGGKQYAITAEVVNTISVTWEN